MYFLTERMKKILFIFGTRPEGIKLAPLIEIFSKDKNFETVICVTSQHREMLEQVVRYFQIKVNLDLQIMVENQSLDYITSKTLTKLESVFKEIKPNLTIVQGDATTSFAGALASFYHKVPIAHIEAGLRTFDKYFPYPEEINRCLITQIADYHFAPTESAVNNLINEHIPNDRIFLVGNTTIDSQIQTLKFVEENEKEFYEKFKGIDFEKKLILITCHRRENFGKPFEEVCDAINELVTKYNEIEIIFPVHYNPNIRKIAYSKLKSPKIHLLEPLDYPSLLFIMKQSYLILSDSGGIQEEAPSLGKPVLVLREKTERIESIELGISKVIGTNKEKILYWVDKLLTDVDTYKGMAKICFPYGNGTASTKIYNIIKELDF